MALNPTHTEEKYTPHSISVKKLYLKISPNFMSDILNSIYSENSENSHRIYEIFKNYQIKGLLNDFSISVFRNRGIELPNGQYASFLFERALRCYHILNQIDHEIDQHLFFCGIDNVCASGLFVPYILFLAGIPLKSLPILHINDLCLLENTKFSTSKGHAIWLNQYIEKYSSSLIRYSLSNLSEQNSIGNFIHKKAMTDYRIFCKKILSFMYLIRELQEIEYLTIVESGAWSNTDILFYKNLLKSLNASLEYCRDLQFNQQIKSIHCIMEDIQNYANAAKRMHAHGSRRTKLYLLLFSLKIFAISIYSIFHETSNIIYNSLGLKGEAIRSSDIELCVFRNTEIDIFVKYIEGELCQIDI